METKHIYRENFFTTGRGVKIYYQYWLPSDNHRANLIFVHGMGEHSGRYQNIVNYLCPKGFALFGLDLQGHGKSEGKRGHVAHLSDFAGQIEQLINTTKDLRDNKDLYLYGHSMGGLIVLDYLLQYPNRELSGVIFTSPAFDIALKIPAWKMCMGKLISVLAPSVTMNNGIDPDDLSHDKIVVEKYKKDELVHDRASAGLFFSMLSTIKKANLKAPDIHTPVLLMLGDKDNIISKDGALSLFNKLGSNDKKSHICPGSSHELLNEIDKENNLDIIRQWLEPRLDKK